VELVSCPVCRLLLRLHRSNLHSYNGTCGKDYIRVKEYNVTARRMCDTTDGVIRSSTNRVTLQFIYTHSYDEAFVLEYQTIDSGERMNASIRGSPTKSIMQMGLLLACSTFATIVWFSALFLLVSYVCTKRRRARSRAMVLKDTADERPDPPPRYEDPPSYQEVLRTSHSDRHPTSLPGPFYILTSDRSVPSPVPVVIPTITVPSSVPREVSPEPTTGHTNNTSEVIIDPRGIQSATRCNDVTTNHSADTQTNLLPARVADDTKH
jgi:hypothetical protein